MSELAAFVKKNRKNLAKADYDTLIQIADQIPALKTEKDQNKRAAAKELITLRLNHLWKVAQLSHGPTSIYADMDKKDVLKQAVSIATKILREK